MEPFLSLIVPAHNEQARLPASLPKIHEFLASQPFSWEVVVVDSGSRDGTAQVVRDFAARWSGLRLVQVERPGKGLAVRTGMLAARGDYRFICDADLSMPIDQVPRFLPPAAQAADIAIASREVPGAARHDEPAYRHLIGRAFNLLVRRLTIPEIQDTQCGFKCFRRAVAEDLFRVQRLDGWTFDVEILYVALRRGYRIIEIPIPWYYTPGSRVRVVRDSLTMFTDLFRIRRNWRRGLYAPA
ncbi:MAG: Glycosyltransferase family 2 protein [Anaerolineales bacterium]|nr:Glycosyltransferase family 2 protein [Anaerolineales bacterium]